MEPLDSPFDLPRVPDEFLAQPHGSGVLEVCTSGLDDRHEFLGLVLQGRLKMGHCGKEAVVNGAQGGDVYRGRNYVIGGLADVHVVIWMHGIARTTLASKHLDRAIGDHLVGVHVRRGARSGLEDIHDKLVVMHTVGYLCRCLTYGVCKVLVEQSQIGVHLRRCELDLAYSPNE